jgi:hypothetical protein
MALEILALNPATKPARRKKATKAKGKGENMARKKRKGGSRRGRGRSRRSVSIARLRNPGPEDLALVNPRGGRMRRAARRGGQFLGASGIAGAAKSVFPMLLGAFACKVAQKKFGDKTEESGNWTWKDYMTGVLGTFVAGLGAKYVFRASPATSQKVLEGGLLILAFKLITNELVPKSETAKAWLGDDGDGMGADDEGSYSGFGVGDLYESEDGQTYVLGDDGYWRPWDSSHRALPAPAVAPAVFGEELQPPGRLGGFGEELQPPGRLGGFGEELSPPGRLGDPYAAAYGNW